MRRSVGRIAVLLVAAIAIGGCLGKQKIALDCVPQEVVVFVDGRKLEGRPQEIKLSKDEPHTIFLRSDKYHSQMVVMDSKEVDGKPQLSPDDLCTTVVFAQMVPDLKMVVDPEDSAEPAKDDTAPQ